MRVTHVLAREGPRTILEAHAGSSSTKISCSKRCLERRVILFVLGSDDVNLVIMWLRNPQWKW